MLNIYAQTFMHATRTGQVKLRDVPPTSQQKRARWFSRPKTRLIDPKDL